jgi:calcineurin-like phosphoesterase family protein
MHNIFFISDSHFGHGNSLTFKRNDGTPLRCFSSVEEMDETMVENWNKVVRPVDKIYHLGDVVINRKSLPILKRLNGKKRLVRGNHDIFTTKDFLEHFDEIYGVRVFSKEGFICSHIPLHPESLYRWKLNVHGHTHANSIDDPKYKCVSVEQTNYSPVHMDVILDIIKANKDRETEEYESQI